jgi:hypothetical protein
MKALKTCKTGCGKMQSGGPVKKVKKMAQGGAMNKPQIYGIPQTGTTNYSAPTMKKGGMVKNAKLASFAAPKDKVTRADVIAGALKNKRKKK